VQSQDLAIEIERKLYAVAIGFCALGVVVFCEIHFLKPLSRSTWHILFPIVHWPIVVLEARIVGYQILAVLICLPFTKAITRVRLSLVDALILGAPTMYMHSLVFCDGFAGCHWLLCWPGISPC
jgi:hypothetical protein